MSAFQYILSIALGQGIVLAFFLLTSKYYKSKANTWLAFALILLSVLSVVDLLGGEYVANSMFVEFLLHDLELEFLIYVPLYYFFSISTSNVPKEGSFNVFLLLPFVIDTIINIVIVCSLPIEEIADHYGVQAFYEAESVSAIAFNFFLSYQSYRLIKTNVSDSEKKNWIFKVWQSTFVLLLAWILMTVGGYIMSTGLVAFIISLYILMSIWMFWLIYNGIVNLKLIDDRKRISLHLQDRVIQQNHVQVPVEAGMASQEGREGQQERIHHKSNQEVFEGHFEKINAIMISESLYRNEDLALDDVAQRIDMSSSYVSKIIKKATNKSFPVWINEFRVAEVKTMFKDRDFDNYTTLSIGLEAGFKSKSAFYSVFKKITGETPAKFRKKKS